MTKQISIDVFDNDERIIINKACESVVLSGFSRAAFLANLSFARNISTDTDILNMLDGLIAKISRISDSEWSHLKLSVPFETFYTAELDADDDVQEEAI